MEEGRSCIFGLITPLLSGSKCNERSLVLSKLGTSDEAEIVPGVQWNMAGVLCSTLQLQVDGEV